MPRKVRLQYEGAVDHVNNSVLVDSQEILFLMGSQKVCRSVFAVVREGKHVFAFPKMLLLVGALDVGDVHS